MKLAGSHAPRWPRPLPLHDNRVGVTRKSSARLDRTVLIILRPSDIAVSVSVETSLPYLERNAGGRVSPSLATSCEFESRHPLQNDFRKSTMF